ncbi:hypothetical protein [Streptomyces hirsutus]|uniref:hypothetical protein n=1 Tax=Streptomyces hirsutus TaxID=35620 RepID=UPI001470666C|nr:hypothetical protein [Streptomyces hirsutus]
MAGLVTAAAFTVPAWLCGAVVLPTLLKDPAIRWSLASVLGAVLGSLAVLWGHGFATRATATGTSGRSAQATGERSVAISGNPAGDISTGDTGASSTPSSPPARPEPTPPTAAPAPPQSSVTASGERSIAISGNPGGTISTGDHHSQGPA